MGSLVGDLKLSLRQLAKAPGFTLASVVVLSLGIGLNAAMFSLVYALGFMGRPYAEPDRVVQLYSSQVKEVDSYRAFSYAAYRAYDALPYIPLYRQNDLYAASRTIVFQPRLDRRVLGRELAWTLID